MGISGSSQWPSRYEALEELVEILRSYMSGERKSTLACIPTLALSSIYTEPRTNETRMEHVNVRISTGETETSAASGVLVLGGEYPMSGV
jgi:hypothetical protein